MRGRGQRAGLSRDQVVASALALLRRDGLERVSMRRLAAELGVAPNAIYSHVPDKDALLDALLDAVLADVAVPARGGWRARVEALLADTRRVLLAHPDLVPHYLARQTTGPNALRLGEALLEQLHRGGVARGQAATALQVLLVHTIGGVAFEVPRSRDPDPEARASRGRAAVSQPALPRSAAVAEDLSRHRGEAVFRSGLQWILDGLAHD